MSDQHGTIPRPTPVSSQPLPEIPPEMQPPPPSPLGVECCSVEDHFELGIGLKITYGFVPGKPLEKHDEQMPLLNDNVAHDELVPGRECPMKAVPELMIVKAGTDCIIRGHARPSTPVPVMQAGVTIGSHAHIADVMGNRVVEAHNGNIAFTPPEPFSEMPLRYELAYGGTDHYLEKDVAEKVKAGVDPDSLLRILAAAKDLLKDMPPVSYPRNPYGQGYVVTSNDQALNGLALPNIELANQRLTPETLVPPKFLAWPRQPIPAGFDFMDPTMFPRTAMMGFPPPHEGEWHQFPEVRSGQVPPDFCRGNALHTEKDKIPDLVHPELSRCAPIGLRLPFLRGNEAIRFLGMDPEFPDFVVMLPREKPIFRLTYDQTDFELPPQLIQVFTDVDNRRVTLLWCARTPWERDLVPGEEMEIMERITWKDHRF